MLRTTQEGNQNSLEVKLAEVQKDNVELKKQIIKLIR